jgi:hypothetical protein
MRHRLVVLAALLVTAAAVAVAQSPRPGLAPGNTVLLAAYTCAPDQLSKADAVFSANSATVLNKYVASGRIISWGYLGTSVGGPANRHVYIWAADPVALLQARKDYLPEIQAQPGFAEFSRICGSATVTLSNLIAISGSAPK